MQSEKRLEDSHRLWGGLLKNMAIIRNRCLDMLPRISLCLFSTSSELSLIACKPPDAMGDGDVSVSPILLVCFLAVFSWVPLGTWLYFRVFACPAAEPHA